MKNEKKTFTIDDRPAKERIKAYEEKHGKLKPLTEEEKREYGLA